MATAGIVNELKTSNHHHRMHDHQTWLEQREEYLNEFGLTNNDVMEDEYGEFFYTQNENGNPGEDGYAVDWQKVYLPAKFQSSYVPED